MTATVRTLAAAVVGAALGGAAALGLAATVASPPPLHPTASELAAVQLVTPATAYQPSCPTEDSCRPVYADGRWVIVADRP